jgi:ribonuclease R
MNQTHFPKDVLIEANSLKISEQLLLGRQLVEGITIDGPASRDLDDAIHLEYRQNEFVVHVSISDVTELIKAGSPIFDEALKRVATRYLSNGNIPMIPENLSENMLSLLEEQARPALTFSITLSRNLDIIKIEINRTILKSRRRLNYAQVDYILENHPNDPDYQLLNDCYILARRLLDYRSQQGALAIYDLQQLIFTNEEGQLVKMRPEDAHKSNIIVQEFMILVNMAVAELAAERGYLFLFRNHTARQTTPQRDEILDQLKLAINNLHLQNSLGRRTELWFNRAKYEPVLKGHYGLNLSAYTHVTSPLRRFPDLINHALLKAQIWGTETDFSIEQLQDIAREINEVLLRTSENKRKFFKEQSQLQTKTQLADVNSEDLVKMSSGEFKRVIKEACRSRIMNDEIETALLRRFEEKRIGVEHISFLLFETEDSNERWRQVRDKALEVALNTVGFSQQLLHYQMQSGRFADFRIDIKDHQNGFAARFIASLDEEELTTKIYAIGNNKKEAQYGAANEFLQSYLRRTLVSPNKTIEPEQEETLNDRNIVTPADKDIIDKSFFPEENYVGQLGELCINRPSRSMPIYEFTKSGPSHAPTITCTCGLKFGNKFLKVNGTSSNKKIAKQIAAMNMLDELLNNSIEELNGKISGNVVSPEEISDERIEENYIGILNDKCLKADWRLPRFSFSSAGPSHQPTFTCKVIIKTPEGISEAAAASANKKNAKQKAAREILKQIE